MDTAFEGQDAEEWLLWTTSQKREAKISFRRMCWIVSLMKGVYKLLVVLFKLFELGCQASNVPHLCSQRPAFGRQIIKNDVDSVDVLYKFLICLIVHDYF